MDLPRLTYPPSVMEEQASRHSPQDNQGISPTTTPSTHSGPDDLASKSVPTLRFPRPQGSQTLANWVSSSSPDIMASPKSYESDNSLSESTFEFISRETTEDSSQDERADSMSESLSEYERYPNPDEVQAFNGLDDMSNSVTSTMTTDSDEDEEEEEEEDEEDEAANEQDDGSLRSVFSYAQADPDEILRNSLRQSSITRPFPPTASPSLPVHSIEFSEPEDIDVHIDKISVKHTIKEFSEEEAAEFFERVGLGEVPQRLSATIRQTMSQRCLSTHEAFRVLYVGDEALKGEIILKISRAITCSSSVDYNENKTLRKNTEGVYNIVPVTFGAIKDRDVELMEASGFQIKVDTCLGAEKIPIDSRYFCGDIIYSLTVDGGNGGKKYKSVPAGGPEGARVQPAWTLPHIAVFYSSEIDDEDLQSVQNTAWEFCRRHAIPTLFISDHPAFASPIANRWINHMNEHAVCLSLESRGWKTEQRFPIDLTSFLNIDNRQMNQNLAYLTGLQEPVSVADEKMRDVISLSGSEQDLPDGELDLKELKSHVRRRFRSQMDGFLRAMENPRHMVYLFIIAFVVGLVSLSKTTHLSAPSGISVSDGSYSTPSLSTAATATITINHTSTKTVRIESTEMPSFGGFLSDIAHTMSAEGPKGTVCSVELHNEYEILIKLPSGTKETWLAKGAIDINVFRGNDVIPSRLSSTAEGILVQIPNEETHGVVNVSVVTTRKPKVNETFAVDFGTPLWSDLMSGFLHKFRDANGFVFDMAQKAGETADEAVKTFENNYASVLAAAEEQIKEKAVSWWSSIKDASKVAHIYSSQKAGETYDWVKDSLRPEDAARVLKDAQETVTDHLHHVENLRDEGKLAMVKAQVASKLWWLKVQGKMEEHKEYERQARNFMLRKHEEAGENKKRREVKAQFQKCIRTGSGPCRCKNKGLGRWMV